jgi:hypothetical protein
MDTVVVSILAKDKGHILPMYLRCLLAQTYPKDRIHLYIKTNDNTDDTEEVLSKFVSEHGNKYLSVFFEAHSVDEGLKQYTPHEWNSHRFKVLGKIRQDSIEYAIKKNSHYFVVDCDNLIVPNTLSEMVNLKSMNVIAPILIRGKFDTYSNYHYDIDSNGYYKYNVNYFTIYDRQIVGIHEVKVVHCTYFINNRILDKVSYDDDSYRYEYVIFSDILRKNNIPQYIDNRRYYGILTMTDTLSDLLSEIETCGLDKLFPELMLTAGFEPATITL